MPATSTCPRPRPTTCWHDEYAREALKNGLALEKRLGTNPYKFGLIGSTDSHTALAPPRRTTSSASIPALSPQPNG